MYKEIKELLHTHKLKEALEKLSEYASPTDNWQMKSDIESLKTTYGFMMQYATQGMNDPERNEMYNNLLKKAFVLNEKIKIQLLLENGNSYVSQTYRNTRNSQQSGYYEICTKIEELHKELNISDMYDEPYRTELIESQNKRLQFILEELFNKTWAPVIWNEEDYTGALSIIESDKISDNEKALFTSALCLSLIHILDVYKFRLLLHTYLKGKSCVVTQRALVGILIAIYLQDEMIKFAYPNLTDEINLLKENPYFLDDLYTVIIQVILSLETENIDKKMRDEIIPSIMQSTELTSPINEMSDINIEELIEGNPEWRESIEKIKDQIKELDMLRQEGADTNMCTFSNLKNYPFFYEPSHWFYIFSSEVPAIYEMMTDKKNNYAPFIETLQKATDMCNSDRFSLCLTFKSMPNLPLDAMNSGLTAQNKMNEESEGTNSEKKKRQTESRHFIQDLYRFCKLWRNNYYDKIDIFSQGIALWQSTIIRNMIQDSGKLKQLADYLFAKGHVNDAMFSYMDIIDDNPDDYEAFQKIGYVHVLNKDYDKALDSLKKADILSPGDTWTLKNIALCYKKKNRYDLAYEYLKEAEQINPDDLNICTQIGQALITEGIYDEALRYMFKVEYMTKGKTSAQRAIAWCYFMMDRYDKAIEMYNKILDKNDAIAEDWINTGHVYLVNNDIKSAISFYKKAIELQDKKTSFYEIFSSDIKTLKNKGVDEVLLNMIPDMTIS
ncbi:tetratricopeptide repeat protein [Bacteroides caecigallinarum]|uniref:tetratricopeptide repeat protein n=1 Tax=Bacteroides caecigallinarum TaxID=1411144 RepID=UPI001F32659A|nr:tetratricopeptide repeat protein [Bacteroides caecigallinarum]MCF2550472.1 tetratricopeptide repeat protein [Bacteroides caecigallinarum]